MMLPTQGPDSTLMEDLSELNLIEGNGEPSAKSNAKGGGYAQTDAKGGDFAGPDDGQEGPQYKEGDYMVGVGDEAAGTRKNVPVRSGGLNRSEVGPSAGNPAMAEDAASTNNKLVPSFLIPTEEEVAEAEEELAEAEQKNVLSRAWETIEAYFTEDEDGLNEAGLRGVINAMGYALDVAVEDIANLASDNDRLSEAVQELNGLLYEAECDDDKKKDDGDDDDDDDDDDAKDEKKGKKLPPWLKKGVDESRRGGNLTEDNSLLDELRSLGEDRAVKALDTQSELIDGFETIAEACNDIVNRIVEVMAEDQDVTEAEDLEVDESSDRVQLARFFESIAGDAEVYLEALTSGEVPFKVAEADLSKLYGDLERGIEQMHDVE